jgi:ADP-ribose pyrophosphatase YjhB (NUDIX family)
LDNKKIKYLQSVAKTLGLEERFFKEVQVLTDDFREIEIAEIIDKPYSFNNKTAQRIEETWQKASEKNPQIFSGGMGSVMSLRIDQKRTLLLHLRKIRFKTFLGLREFSPSNMDLSKQPLDKDYPLPIGVGAVSITSDNKIIFGRRSSSTFEKGESTSLPSGYYDYDTDKSIPETFKKELKEEIGIEEYNSIQYLGIAYTSGGKNPLIYAVLKLRFSSEHIKLITQNASEIDKYYFIDNNQEALKEFFKEHPPTSHDVARVTMYLASINKRVNPSFFLLIFNHLKKNHLKDRISK